MHLQENQDREPDRSAHPGTVPLTLDPEMEWLPSQHTRGNIASEICTNVSKLHAVCLWINSSLCEGALVVSIACYGLLP